MPGPDQARSVAVPVTVVTGFLGAGKTTLVNRWLADFAPGEVAVIVNEHGTVGIDGELLAERVRELVEINGGCVCCVTQAELVRALDALATSTKRPGRILIETSGAASPAGVLRTIARGGRTGAFALDGVVTVVDASRLSTLDEHELALEQLGYADIVVLSRADACGADERARALTEVTRRNGAAHVALSDRGDLVDVARPGERSLDALLDRRRGDFARTPRASDVDDRLASPHVYESVSLVHEGDVDGERFADFVEAELARSAGRLFRLKGILSVAGAPSRMIVQGVADLVEVTFGAPWNDAPRTSRLVVVGFGLEREALSSAFRGCCVERPPFL